MHEFLILLFNPSIQAIMFFPPIQHHPSQMRCRQLAGIKPELDVERFGLEAWAIDLGARTEGVFRCLGRRFRGVDVFRSGSGGSIRLEESSL